MMMVICSQPECQTTAGCVCGGKIAMTYESAAEAQIERLHDEIEKLKELLRHADGVVAWEATPARHGFQEEIEAALGIGDAGTTAGKEP